MVTDLLEVKPAPTPAAAAPAAAPVAPAKTTPPAADEAEVATPPEPEAEAAKAPEPTPAGDKPAEKAAEPGAVGPYSDLIIPEDSKLKPEDLAEVVDLATRHKLPLDVAAEILAQREAALEQRDAGYQTMADEWAASVEADPEIGGAKMADTMAAAHAAIVAHGPPGFLEALVSTRLGNYPPFVKFAASVGRKLMEPKQVQPAATESKGPRSEEERWALRYKNSGPMPPARS